MSVPPFAEYCLRREADLGVTREPELVLGIHCSLHMSATPLAEEFMTITRTFPVLLITLLCAACAKKPEPPATQPASSAATATADSNASEFKIGELSAVALRDGEIKVPNDGKTFGVGHSPEEVAKLLSAAGASTQELALGIQPLLVRTGDKVLLFDTGSGTNFGPTAGKLAVAMKEAGIDPASVTDIFISHVHGDHVGGLVDTGGSAVLPNATIHLSAPEWDYLKGMDAKAASSVGLDNHAALVSAMAPKVDAFAPGSELIPGVVKAVDIKGHTPGHSGYLIGSGADSLLYIGDTAHHYIVSVQEPDWTIAFDGDAPTAQASRKELIARSAESGQRIYAVHFPFPGLGKFTKRGDGFVWTPQ
jgi:glyoxylase-like metal-dependent hydrolase (beta-lactamase superfamily II)